MAEPIPRNGIWRLVAGVSIASVLTGAGAWLTFGQDRVSYDRMREYVNGSQKTIVSEVRHNASEIARLRKSIDNLMAIQQECVVQNRVMAQSLQALTKALEKR